MIRSQLLTAIHALLLSGTSMNNLFLLQARAPKSKDDDFSAEVVEHMEHIYVDELESDVNISESEDSPKV